MLAEGPSHSGPVFKVPSAGGEFLGGAALPVVRRATLWLADLPMATPDPWETLTEEIAACRRCSLHRSRTRVVVYRGARRPTVVFVGEAPGATEDATGVPFVGRAGHRLDAAIASVRLAPERYGILNLIKCRPPENRFDVSAEEACRPFLARQLDLLAPKALITLGARALAAFDPSAPPVLAAAGRPRTVGDRELFPLLHPAAVRSRATADRWATDVRALGEWLRVGPAREPL
jgi:uracil-DNA glycosylase